MKKLLLKALSWLPCIIAIFCFFHYMPHGHAQYAMPFGSIGAYVCKALQAGLVDYFGKNAPQYRTLGSVSFIKWLLSPQNTNGFKKISEDIKGVPGKKRGVAFRVDDAYCFNLCALAVDCTTNNVQYVDPASREIVFDLTNPPFRHCDDEGRPVKLRFKEADLEKYCTVENQDYIREQIFRYLLRFEEGLDKAITVLMGTQVGSNARGEAITNIPIFTSANSFTPGMAALNPEALFAVNQTYQDMGYDNQFGVIGGTIVNKIAEYKKWATWNAAGLDLSKADGLTPFAFYNRNFNATFGEKDFIVAAPGAQQLVMWNKYKGERVRGVTDLYSKATIILPTTGLEVDWKWTYDYSCEEWIFEAFLHAELATVMPGGCSDTDNGVDVSATNGIIRVHDCGVQPIMPVCPELP